MAIPVFISMKSENCLVHFGWEGDGIPRRNI